jgi:hypothetical protein
MSAARASCRRLERRRHGRRIFAAGCASKKLGGFQRPFPLYPIKTHTMKGYAEILLPNVIGNNASVCGRRPLGWLAIARCCSFCLHRRALVERDRQRAKSGEPRHRRNFPTPPSRPFFQGNVRFRRGRHRSNRTRNSGRGRREDLAAGDAADAEQLSGEMAAGQRCQRVSAGCFNYAVI